MGYALFQTSQFNEGLPHFDKAIKLAQDMESLPLHVQCLGLKTLAYQSVQRLPEAYKTAQEVERLADLHQDSGIKCDALASRAQILLDSGDEMGSFPMFDEALSIAQEMGDKRREMNVLGALGNYSLKLASIDRAGAQFEQALRLAREIGDRAAEIGFMGNVATLLEMKEQYTAAEMLFLEVLAYVHNAGDQHAEVQTLRHLVTVSQKQNKHEKVVEFANQGIPLAQGFDKAALFGLSEALITAYYQLSQVDEAHEATKQTIAAARTVGEKDKEASFLLSLAESYMITDAYEAALDTYILARKALKRRSRLVDVAHVTGRMGMVLAELGRVDEAIPYHQDAIELARKQELPDLEGEQFMMLAMAYRESGDLEQARLACETAVSIYTNADLPDNAIKAQKLLTEIG